jgi:hypothetical protein
MTGPKVDGAAPAWDAPIHSSAAAKAARAAGADPGPESLRIEVSPSADYWRERSSFLTFLASFFSFMVLAGSFLLSFLLSCALVMGDSLFGMCLRTGRAAPGGPAAL